MVKQVVEAEAGFNPAPDEGAWSSKLIELIGDAIEVTGKRLQQDHQRFRGREIVSVVDADDINILAAVVA